MDERTLDYPEGMEPDREERGAEDEEHVGECQVCGKGIYVDDAIEVDGMGPLHSWCDPYKPRRKCREERPRAKVARMWVCRVARLTESGIEACGHMVMSVEPPAAIRWDDGHTCYFRPEEE